MLIDAKTEAILREKFERELRETVDIKVFARNIIIGDEDPQYSQFSTDLVRELSQISDRIKGEFLGLESTEAKELNLSISPTILIGKELGYSIEYWGAPAGYQASPFIETISLVSQAESGLSAASKEKLKSIDKHVLIETYVSLDSPHCPQAVLLSNRIAVEVPGKVTSRCIDAAEVRTRAREFKVSQVPQQIINEDMDSIALGVQSEGIIVNQVISFGSSRAEEILSREREELKKKQRLIDKPDYPIILNNSNFDQAVDKYPFLVVDCWAEWCAPCLKISPAIEKLAAKYAGKVTFGKLNIDENREVAFRFQIMSIPTLLVFKNGRKVDSIVGALPESVLEKKITAHI